MKRLIILAATLIAGLSACDSLLDKEPLDRVTQFDYFKTRSDLELFSNPFYDNLLDKTPYDEQNDLLVQMTLSDVLYGGDKRTVPNTGGGWSWGNLRRINTLLEYVDQCEDKKAVTEYTALAKFFRAAFYFDKVKRFGDVPWYEVQLGSADEALYKPRDSRELIMTNMIKDIDEAINSGGLTEDISTYRVNKWAALALKARFCLFEGTYRKYHGINLEGHDYTYYLEEAAKAAKTIIDEGPYKLYSTKTPDKDYMMLFAQENASTEEYILAIRNSYEAQVYHNATAYTLLPTQGRPGYTRKFINMYLKKDELDVQLLGRGFAWLDTGTMDSLVEAADFVRMIEQRQGIKISAPEEIAYKYGWINRGKLLESAERYGKSPYGQHLRNVADDRLKY